MDVFIRSRNIYVFGPFRLDPVRRVLSCDGEPVKPAARLFDTLLYLIENHGRLVEKDELLSAIWGGRIVEDSSLTQAISALRKILQAGGGGEAYIATAPGRGYRFAAPIELVADAPEAPPDGAAPDATPVAFPGEPPGLRRRIAPAAVILALATAIGVSFVRLTMSHEPSAPIAIFAAPPGSVAVLAFTNMSGDPAQDYFADGLAEELTNTLSRVSGLRVAARTSAFSFKGKPATAQDVGRALNVGAVLEGSVRRDGTRLRITVQLIDATTGFADWSHRYDRDFGGVLTLQTEIAEDVARSLQVTLQPDDPARLALGGTRNAAAFDRYLRGMRFMRDRNETGYHAALSTFDDALRLDPDFAAAHVKRAFALMFLANGAPTQDTAEVHRLLAEAISSADRAVAIAPDWGPAHAARGGISLGLLDLGEAARELTRARALAPGDSSVDATYSWVEAYLGHADEAAAAAARVVAAGPLDSYAYADQASVLYLGRRYEASLAALQHVRALAGALPPGDQLTAALDDLALGDIAAAQHECTPARTPQQSFCMAILARRLGKPAEANAQLAAYRAVYGDTAAYQYAQVYAQWGDESTALGWLETASTLHDTGLAMLRTDPLLDPIRMAPGFKAAERQLHLPP